MVSGATERRAPEIEIWFDFGSTYSYLSVMRIEDAAKLQGVRVAWRPFLLGVIFRSMGMNTSPFVLQKAKGAYVWRDMERQCRKYGLRWVQPSSFPRVALLPSRIALVGAEEPWIGAFCRRVMELNFVEDQDINDAGRVGSLLSELGLPTSDLLHLAQSEAVKGLLREQTEEARARGIFGAPTLFAGEEMFWGNDRLDDALAVAGKDSANQ